MVVDSVDNVLDDDQCKLIGKKIRQFNAIIDYAEKAHYSPAPLVICAILGSDKPKTRRPRAEVIIAEVLRTQCRFS